MYKVNLRTKKKVRVSPKGWRTVFDSASAKIQITFQFSKKQRIKFFSKLKLLQIGVLLKNKNCEKHKKDNYKDASPMLVLYRKLMRN